MADVLESLNSVAVLSEGLVDVVGVGRESGALHLVRVGVSLSDDFSAGHLVPSHHLDAEDVVNLNIMSRKTVVQEGRREHQVVSVEPELGLVLVVEQKHVLASHESEVGNQAKGAPGPHPKAGVVQGAISNTNVPRQNLSLHGNLQHNLDPVEVEESHVSAIGVSAILSLTNLEVREETTNTTRTTGESLVNEMLESGGVTENPGLKSS